MDTSLPTQRTEIFEGPVSREWLARGEFLSVAWRKFDSDLLGKAKKHALDFARANGIDLPDDGDACCEMALNFAEGAGFAGTVNNYENRPAGRLFDTFRRLAHGEIRRRFCGAPGALTAYGRRDNAAGAFEWIPADAWPRLRQDENIPNFVSGGGVSYYMVRVIDELAWLTDKPPAPETPITNSGVDNHQIYQTGAPGRPTSIHLVKNELIRRATVGQVNTTSIRQEARSLSEWLKQAHPEAPAMTPKTIENRIGEMWRKLQSQSIPKRNEA